MIQSDRYTIENSRCAIIIGSYVNACSINRALLDIAYSYPIYIVETGLDSGICLADIAAKNAKVVKKWLHDPSEIIEVIGSIAGQECQKTIFFTSEECMDPVKIAIQEGRLKNILACTGAKKSNDVIFDRYLFYSFVSDLDCITVPKTVEANADPFVLFGDTFVFRFKRSWEDRGKLPSLRIVNGRDELQQIEKSYSGEGLTQNMWCYQELLSVSDKHNVSVCGWHDDEFRQYAVTRKVIQHPPKTGNGDVVETISNFPRELVSATETILSAMQYAGPFEMEFVYDLKARQYKVIELNPRFWMQHALIDRLTGHSLIKRMLGESVWDPIPPEKLPHQYWVNGNQMLFRLCTGQLTLLPYAINGWWYPKMSESLRWAFYYKKYKSELRNHAV